MPQPIKTTERMKQAEELVEKVALKAERVALLNDPNIDHIQSGKILKGLKKLNKDIEGLQKELSYYNLHVN